MDIKACKAQRKAACAAAAASKKKVFVCTKQGNQHMKYTFKYWKTVELMPGVTAQIVNETIKSDQAFYEDIVDYIQTKTDFQWSLSQTTVIGSSSKE
jgi:hypothetical protein